MPNIAERLGTTVGAVVGRASRLKLPKITYGFARPSRKVAPMLAFSEERTAPKPPQVLFGRCKTCQWIEGEPSVTGTKFCDAPTSYKSSWCATHYDIVFGYVGD